MIEVIKSPEDLARQKWDVLVPTMGALHAGHKSLIKLARDHGENVIVSIFVNPLQFEKKSDLESYPKTLNQDLDIAAEAGAKAVFAPSEEDIYPGNIEKISAGNLGDLYEGASRPGHFSGVLTVVKRLFYLVNPEKAVFGEKDFQQLFLIKKMTNQLSLPTKVLSGPTIRDSQNLALSSRHKLLSEQEKRVAQIIYKALSEKNIETARKVFATEPRFKLDYLETIDEDTFEIAKPESRNKRLIVAGWIKEVRLIDNMPMGESK
ncbi:MAG: pantoate--beta-alanine ligase [Candidatus Nanopelagicus sp.]